MLSLVHELNLGVVSNPTRNATLENSVLELRGLLAEPGTTTASMGRLSRKQGLPQVRRHLQSHFEKSCHQFASCRTHSSIVGTPRKH